MGDRAEDLSLFARRVAGFEANRQAAVVNHHQHGLRPRRVDFAARVHRFLGGHAVIGLDALQRDAVTRRCADQDRHQDIKRAVADQAEPVWLLWGELG